MYGITAIILAAAALVFTLALPFCRIGWTRRLVAGLAGALAGRSDQALYYSDRDPGETRLQWVRAWGITASLFFAAFGILHGRVFFNDPRSLILTGLCALLAMVSSAVLILTVLSFVEFIPRLRGHAALKSTGMRGIWQIHRKGSCVNFQRAVSAHLATASSVGVIDVTGYEILGKGPGPSGGILYDLLAAWNTVPVTVLLLHPQSHSVDPDRRMVSVSNEVLGEMGISDSMYRRRFRSTLDAINDLNENRSKEARIRVCLYTEKPSVSAVVFDECAFVAPWNPQEDERLFALYEANSGAACSSFFEVFRRHFVRLWRGGRPLATAPAPPASGLPVERAPARRVRPATAAAV